MNAAPPVSSERGFARLLGLALLAALVLAVADVLIFLHGAEAARLWLEFLAYLAAAAVAFGAARAFEPGDHLRPAWYLLAVNLFLVGSLALFPGELLEGPTADERVRWAASLVTVVANGCGLWGMARFALTWRRAGLLLPGSAWRRYGAEVVLLGAALLALGPDILAMARLAVAGDVWSAAALIADLCDLTLLLLFLPVFLTAWTFAGGALAWPFGFLAASDVAWIVFDGFQTYKGLLGLSPAAAKFVSAFLHRLAAMLVLAGATAQRMALRRAEVGPQGPGGE
ncbi:MAG TPA: hypothetical protein VMU15_14415 [Anaeromyxobacter sp.]|nr:hypothetical protein [Anaeromyxobacter sp.]